MASNTPTFSRILACPSLRTEQPVPLMETDRQRCDYYYLRPVPSQRFALADMTSLRKGLPTIEVCIALVSL
jgi:hypothetical protein